MVKSNAKDNNKDSENTKEPSTESTGNVSEDGVLANIPALVMTDDGTITWGSLTFPAGTDQLPWLQDLAGGRKKRWKFRGDRTYQLKRQLGEVT